ANAHRLAAGTAAVRARPLAQSLLRADAAADIRHGAGAPVDVGRFHKAAFFRQAQGQWDVVAKRTGELAGRRIRALDAAASFNTRDLGLVVQVDLFKVLQALLRSLFGYRLHVL